jgi:hypothetical protein
MNSQQVQDIRLMYEAVYNEELREKANEYNSIEELDEDLQQKVGKALDAASNFMKTNPVGKSVGAVLAPAGPGRKTPTATSKGYRSVKENIDLFDYLLEYLVAEGYADTNQDALVIMANLSPEDIDLVLSERRREEKGTPRKPRDAAFELVANSMGTGRMGVKPRGEKKVPGKKPPAAGEYGSERRSPAQQVAMRRASAERAREMQSSRFD